MEPDLLRYDDHRGFGHKKTNFFAWTVGILLLSGLAIAAWLGSLYVIGQPERPESYRILQKLHKIEPPKRFALTAAPPGDAGRHFYLGRGGTGARGRAARINHGARLHDGR